MSTQDRGLGLLADRDDVEPLTQQALDDIAAGRAGGRTFFQEVEDRAGINPTTGEDEDPRKTADHLRRQAAYDALRAKLLSRDQLADLPPPQWLIRGLLPDRGLAVLWGKPGAWKTFLALGWAGALASEGQTSTWEGHHINQDTPGRVLYVAGEGAHGLDQRITAFETNYGIHISRDQLTVLPEPVQLLDRNAVTTLMDIAQHGYYGLVILDTFARCLVGGEENSAKDVGQAIEHLRWISSAGLGRLVLVVHHSDKSGNTARGSSALMGAADVELELASDGETAKLTIHKQKDAPKSDPVLLRALPVDDSLVISVSDGRETKQQLERAESQLVSLLAEHGETNGSAFSFLVDLAIETKTMSRATVSRTLKALTRRGIIRNVGTDKRPRYALTTEPTLLEVPA